MTRKKEDIIWSPVRRGMSRDGGYQANLRVGEIAAGGYDVEGRGPGGRFNIIGKPHRRIDAAAKVTGATRFADDLLPSRTLFCRLLRSPHPHARLKAIRTEPAASLPGVKLILTGSDFPFSYGVLPISMDEHALARDRVRFVGDPVAAIVGTSEQICDEAARSIEIDYEPLATIDSPQEALRTPHPRIHDYGTAGNIHKAVHLRFGSVQEAMAASEEVVEAIYFYQGNTHLPLEQHATVASLSGDGILTVWSSTQTPHYLHKAVARSLDLPAASIRIIATPNGGGFGGKSDPFNHEIVAAKAALVLGRPVKITLTREEVFYCHRGRHPVLMRLRTGVDREGRIQAMDLETLLDGGAFGSYGVASTFYTGALQPVTYRLPAYRFRAARTFTNKPPCGPKRGHGTPQPRFAQEVQLDELACLLQKNPADLRLFQLVGPGDLTANYLRIPTIGLRECIERVVSESGYREKWQRLPRGRGIGLACSSYLTGAGLPIYWNQLPHTGVQLKIDRSGLVVAYCGATEIGQGSDDLLASIVCEVLGIPPANVRVVTGDTDLGPVDLGSYSSRVTIMMGNAAIQAAERARAMLAEVAARKMAIPVERIAFAEGHLFDTAEPATGLTFQEACVAAETLFGTLGTVGSYKPPPSPARFKGGGVGPSPTYSYTACIADIEVSLESGIIRIHDIFIAHDIGRVLNPAAARGQVEGSVYMALGETLMEEQSFRRLPKHLSGALVHRQPSMLDYKSPTFLEMPRVHTWFVEQPDREGPFGAKEVGQGPLLPVAPAIANAVFDATGVRIRQVPISPPVLLRAMKRGREEVRQFPEVPWPDPVVVSPPWETEATGDKIVSGKSDT